MFDIWEVVEELVALADERGTDTISMFQIGKELKDAGQNSAQNVQEVHEDIVIFLFHAPNPLILSCFSELSRNCAPIQGKRPVYFP